MIVQLVRMTAKALGDATLGVNAQLAVLSLDATVAGVTDTRPSNIVSVLNQADHNIDVHEADDLTQFPLIVVAGKDPFGGPGQIWTSVKDKTGDVHCVIVVRGSSEAKKYLDADYYLRAMEKAVNAYLLAPSTRDTNGRRNNIQIKSSPHMESSPASGSYMGGEAAGVLKITFDARDLNP